MTQREKIIASGFTNVLFCDMMSLHEEIEKRLGRSVLTHELPALADEIKEAFREDFLKMCHGRL